MIWKHQLGELKISDTPLVMGILNVTPDSFSDGNHFFKQEKAFVQAEKMIQDGADIIDIGGESTRPGATPVPVDEEIRRTSEIIKELHQKWPEVIISVDTYKGRVAEVALEHGVAIINDVSAGRWDSDDDTPLLDVLKNSNAGYVCMHALARPTEMQQSPDYDNAPDEIHQFLQKVMNDLISNGIDPERIICDPGIGFGKTLEHNLSLIQSQEIWAKLKRPILWGLSRKSYIGKILQTETDDRLTGTLASHAWLLANAQTPQIWRVHDVKEARQLIQMWQSLSKPLA